MALEIIVNSFCILIMSILLLSILLQKIEHDKTSLRFAILIVVALVYVITSIASALLEGKPQFIKFSYAVNLLLFLCIDLLVIAFSAYLATLVGRVSKKWRSIMNPGVAFTYLRIILIFVLFFTGNLFTVTEDGNYVDLPLSIIPYVITSLVLVMLMLVVIRNKNYFTKTQTAVILVYLVLPIPGMVAELYTDIYCLSSIAVTLSVLLIYVMVQSSILEDARIRESVLKEMSSTDLLTGLNNRRTYYNRISALDSEQRVGVVFCDINGLKHTNDNFGHAEGDKLINSFAHILTESFDKNDVFRISGDEFVVIVPNVMQVSFDIMVKALKDTSARNENIAAVGSAYGTGCCIEHLVSTAESAMYEDKRIAHENGKR